MKYIIGVPIPKMLEWMDEYQEERSPPDDEPVENFYDWAVEKGYMKKEEPGP